MNQYCPNCEEHFHGKNIREFTKSSHVNLSCPKCGSRVGISHEKSEILSIPSESPNLDNMWLIQWLIFSHKNKISKKYISENIEEMKSKSLTSNGGNVFHFSARADNAEIASFLVKEGFDVCETDIDGNNVLSDAALYDSGDVIRALSKEGIAIRDCSYTHARHPLINAAVRTSPEAIGELLKMDVSPKLKNSRWGGSKYINESVLYIIADSLTGSSKQDEFRSFKNLCDEIDYLKKEEFANVWKSLTSSDIRKRQKMALYMYENVETDLSTEEMVSVAIYNSSDDFNKKVIKGITKSEEVDIEYESLKHAVSGQKGNFDDLYKGNKDILKIILKEASYPKSKIEEFIKEYAKNSSLAADYDTIKTLLNNTEKLSANDLKEKGIINEKFFLLEAVRRGDIKMIKDIGIPTERHSCHDKPIFFEIPRWFKTAVRSDRKKFIKKVTDRVVAEDFVARNRGRIIVRGKYSKKCKIKIEAFYCLSCDGVHYINTEGRSDYWKPECPESGTELTKTENPSKHEDRTEECFIATAAYGNYDHPDVRQLRHFRDKTLRHSALGRTFIVWYYRYGPELAEYVEDRPFFRRSIRWALKRLVGRWLQ